MIRTEIIFALVVFLGYFHTSHAGGYRSYGPEFKATIGEVWPKPLFQDDSDKYYSVDPTKIKFVVEGKKCDILNEAIKRYTKIIRNSAQGYNQAPATPTIGSVEKIRVKLKSACESLPYLGMDESYDVYGDGRVIANSIWGILHGLETLSQLLVPTPDGLLRIPDVHIYDQPRFKYRGLMLDSARHFVSKQKILQLIEGMAYNKLNAFHWHITDDSAFPFNSTVYLDLSGKGAYRPELTYSPADVREIVEYARLRGIRVIPEFDTPAHTASWGASHPEIMTACEGIYAGQLGPLNPTKNSVFEFLQNLFSEIRSLFPDTFIHIGGDELASGCWETNTQIQEYLQNNGLDNGDLTYMYFERFTAQLSKLGWKQMAWQEPMIHNEVMDWPEGTIGQIWFNYAKVAEKITKRGYDIITSDGWYLYVLDTGADWEKFYFVEPTDFDGTDEQKKHVLGGEACLWTEWINEHNVLPTTFPRVSAIAERLWSSKSQRDSDEARLRLEEHNCRMIYRGIEARPANGFGLC